MLLFFYFFLSLFFSDFNYQWDEATKTCKLIPDATPRTPVCIDGQIQEVTGYVKTPLSSCVGGKEKEYLKIQSCGGSGGVTVGKVIGYTFLSGIIFGAGWFGFSWYKQNSRIR